MGPSPSTILVKIDQSSKRGVGVFFLGHEESPQPKAGTRCPLSDLWCQARREMRTQRGSTAHRSASRPSIDRKRPNLATYCQHSTRPDNRLRVSLTFGATCRQIAQVCHHPCCSQVEKSCGCLPSPRRRTRRRFRAAVTTHIVLSWKKLWGFVW